MRLHLSVLPVFLALYLGSPILSWVGNPSPAQAGAGAVSVGFSHVCLLGGDGAASCWGTNTYGQLGDGGTDNRSEPTHVSGGTSFQSISVGHGHACGVAAGGAVHCWGRNGYGELGDGSTTNRSEPVQAVGDMAFEAVAAGTNHTCALTGDGEAYCWGLNSSAQLGVAAGSPSATPVRVDTDARFESITTGVDHTCALESNGRATCWGSNDFGELGDGTRALGAAQPGEVDGPRYEILSAGSNRTCGVTGGGDAYCWGNNNYGVLGDGTEERRGEPTEVAGGHDFSTISSGGVHTCALTDDGDAYCWGLNTFGQLGDGSTTNRLEPAAVVGGHTFASISAGNYGTCALTANGDVHCWGRVAGMGGYEEEEGMTTEPTLVGGGPTSGEAASGDGGSGDGGDASERGRDWAALGASFGALSAQTPPPTVQPGAPGEDTRVLAPDELDGTELPPHTEADLHFMRGMIPHHAQALEMVELLRDRTSNPLLRRLALRIEISQKDEIAMMRRWLRDRDEEAPDGMAHHGHGMMGQLMPGMLTPEQMRQLEAARDAEFDRLFLEFMIVHHEGALVMVKELFASPGAGQGSAIYHFASDVEADQEMEIRRMRALLDSGEQGSADGAGGGPRAG